MSYYATCCFSYMGSPLPTLRSITCTTCHAVYLGFLSCILLFVLCGAWQIKLIEMRFTGSWPRCINTCWRSSSANRRRWSDCRWTTTSWCGSWVRVTLDSRTTMTEARSRRERRQAACSCRRHCRRVPAAARPVTAPCLGPTTVRERCSVRRRAALVSVAPSRLRANSVKSRRRWKLAPTTPARHLCPRPIPPSADFDGPALTTLSTTSSPRNLDLVF